MGNRYRAAAKKSGSQSSIKHFRHQIKRIVNSEIMPDYKLSFNEEKDQLVCYNRKGSKAAKAQFDDQMKTLFKPSKKAKGQAEFDLQ